MDSGQHGLGLLLPDTGTAERKGELLTTTHGQDGVEQASRGKNVHGGQTKIRFQGLVDGLGDDPWMADGVRTVLIHPRVKGGHIHIAYFLALPSHGMQGYGTGSTSKKGLAGFQGSNQIEGTRKLRHGRLVVDQLVPLTLPHFDDSVTRSEQSHAFGERGLIQFLHGSIRRGIMLGVSHGITAGTTMVETPMKFVDGAGQGIVAIDKIAVGDGSDRLFTPVADMSNAVGAGSLLGNLVFLVIEPL